MRMVDVIERKRDGYALTKEEIDFVIKGYTDGSIPDYQMSALAMAIYFQGMNDEERAHLTMAMVHSGDVIQLEGIEGLKVDKHSTGGVGDTVSLILGPMVASVGVPVAKMSGRGLGHTGGTIDKLESLTGFSVELTKEQFTKAVNEHGIAIIGQSGDLTPADKKLYALRDVTATVNSIPLIASSIMSKKIAAGADAIVLDVKTGSGAFMKDFEDAKELAEAMVKIGSLVGRKTMAVISDMNQPLGYAIGNALEVKEAIDTLQGKGPKDLEELCLEIGGRMVYLGKKANSIDEARDMLYENLHNGKALEKFKDFIASQGGDTSQIDDPNTLPQAKHVFDIESPQDGYITELVADRLGVAAMKLGAGRETKESTIDLAVGIVLHKKIGDEVKKGESLATVYSNTMPVDDVVTMIYESIGISSEFVPAKNLIHTIIEG